MPTTPINGLPSPDDNSPNDPPIHFDALNAVLDTRLFSRFPNAAARDAAITAPVEGMAVYVAPRSLVRRGTSWTKTSGPPELLYENPSAGGSGAVNTGAGQVGVLSVNVPASGVASDVGSAVVTLGLKSTAAGGSNGLARLTVAGVTVTVQFNVTSTNPVDLPLVLPRAALPAASFFLGVTLQVDAGVAAQLDHSSIRVSF